MYIIDENTDHTSENILSVKADNMHFSFNTNSCDIRFTQRTIEDGISVVRVVGRITIGYIPLINSISTCFKFLKDNAKNMIAHMKEEADCINDMLVNEKDPESCIAEMYDRIKDIYK